MNPAQFQRVKALFDILADLPEAQRLHYLEQQEDLGESTRRRLHDLLIADAAVAGSTARPALALAAQSGFEPQRWINRRIGAYLIERELGRGGMGSVFLAQRADGSVEQSVAIKIIRPEVLDAGTLARFRLERQVLALLKHPNIAAMLDLGELDDGSPYVVMEYIDGMPITDYVHVHKLDLRQRLQVFLEVCDAVAYAHRNMVVHRDLKPSNVLVGADRHPKLLDFGIAKPLLGQIGSIDIEETGAAHRFFSPHNAAPEQLRGEAITVACDVYGLGALLYELLAGVAPLDLQGKTAGEMEQAILHQDPLPPSARTAREPGSANNAGTTDDSPANRRQWSTSIKGDLDSIALRCLRKSPIERYSTADQLSADIRRFLDGYPVEARRGNTGYRLRRFVGRHRLAVAASALILAIGAISVFSIWRQYVATLKQQSRADAMTTLILEALSSTDPQRSRGKDMSAREVFERVAGQAIANTGMDPEARARLLSAIARIDLRLGIPQQSLLLLDKIDLKTMDAIGRDEALQVRAETLTSIGRFDDARGVIVQGSAQATDQESKAQWAVSEAMLDTQQGKLDAAVRLLEPLKTAAISATLKDQARLRLAWAQHNLGHNDRAEAEFVSLLDEQRQRLPANHPGLFDTLSGLAILKLRAGKTDEAAKYANEIGTIAEQLYSRQSMRFLQSQSVQQLIARERADYPLAIKIETEILTTLPQLVGPFHPSVAKSNFNLASLAEQQGDPGLAEQYYRKAIDIGERAWLPSDSNVLLFRVAFACHLIGKGEYKSAQEIVATALLNAQAHPELKELGTYPVALLVDAIGTFDRTRNDTDRKTVVAALAEARKTKERSTLSAVEEVATAIKRLGIATDG